MMALTLPLDRLKEHLDGTESYKIELKWNLHIHRVTSRGERRPDHEGRKEFVKDVAALVNSPVEDDDRRGYILLGVEDRVQRERTGDSPPPFAVFGSTDNADKFGGTLQRIVSHYLNPPPEISYSEVALARRSNPVGVIVITPSITDVLVFTRNMGEARENDVAWVRRSPQDPFRDRLTLLEIEHLRQSLEDARVVALLSHMRRLEELRSDSLAGTGAWLEAEPKPVPGALAALVSLDEHQRRTAIRSVQLTRTLEDAEKPLYAQVLLGMLRDDSYVVVLEAVKALQHVDSRLAIEGLLEMCRTRADQIVFQGLEALGHLGDRDTMFELERMRTQPEDVLICQRGDSEELHDFAQAVDEAIQAIAGRLEPSPETLAEYVVKARG